jgi:hypothetical protein
MKFRSVVFLTQPGYTKPYRIWNDKLSSTDHVRIPPLELFPRRMYNLRGTDNSDGAPPVVQMTTTKFPGDTGRNNWRDLGRMRGDRITPELIKSYLEMLKCV